ncbi:MAG: hypothetical protein NXI16_07595, partial [Alphaproteobacteria bacterium]|nr:hypothetical protein [Alphaproteobacteria bacterium]
MDFGISSYHPQKVHLSDPDRLKSAVEKACRGNGSLADEIFLSNVKPVDLDSVKKKLGRRWASVAKEVMLVVENSVLPDLDPEDLLIVLGDGQTAILFGTTDAAHIQQQSAKFAAVTNHALGKAGIPQAVLVGANPLKMTGAEAIAAVETPATFHKMVREKEAEQLVKPTRLLDEPGNSVKYAPILEIGRRMVRRYLATPEFGNPKALRAPGSFGSPKDRFMLQSSAREIGRAKSDAGVVVPLGVEAVNDERGRESLLKTLGVLPTQERGRMVLLFRNPTEKSDLAALEKLPTMLNNFGIRMGFCLNKDTLGLADRLLRFDLALLGYDCKGYKPKETNVDGFLALCQRSVVPSLAIEVNRVSVSRDAKKRGFAMMAGKGVAPALTSMRDSFEL